MTTAARLPNGSLCMTPPGGLPSVVDSSALKTLQTSFFVGTTAAAGDELYVVQSPQQVPVGKHWVLTAAGLYIGTNPPCPTLMYGIGVANAGAMGAANGVVAVGIVTDTRAFVEYMRSIQALIFTTIFTGAVANNPLYTLGNPYNIAPGGSVLFGFAVPAPGAAIPIEIGMSFSYIQRDNAVC